LPRYTSEAEVSDAYRREVCRAAIFRRWKKFEKERECWNEVARLRAVRDWFRVEKALRDVGVKLDDYVAAELVGAGVGAGTHTE
jgi:hypothetical protein